jgi:hypothetical protein
MSSSEKDREVWSDFMTGEWFYTDENNATHGPYSTMDEAIEAMQLHGAEE